MDIQNTSIKTHRDVVSSVVFGRLTASATGPSQTIFASVGNFEPMTDVDLASYGRHNDLPPDEPAPREPRGQPSEVHGKYDVWQFDADHSDTVKDTFVVARDPSPLDFRMWVFVGRGQEAHFVMRASHRYGVDEPVPEDDTCCEVLLEGQSLTGDHCPAEVLELVEAVTEAVGVITPPGGSTGADDQPINY